MDFIDQLRGLGDRVLKQKESVGTEEATKNAFIMPFINALGYNVFDPTEVVPEFTADVGLKKGEKVDYAILKEGKPIIIIECKWCGASLSKEHSSQLHRYFGVVEARIGVLTNGVDYWFYSDLEEPNKMDASPFLSINITDLHEALVYEVKKMSKASFDIEQMLTAASDIKYRNAIKLLLAAQLKEPDEDFVKFFASQVHPGRLTSAVKAQFTDLVARAFKEFINERLTGRLQAALSSEVDITSKVDIPDEPEEDVDPEEVERRKRGIVTTEEEMDAFLVAKAVLREVVDVSRISHRDTKSYFGILLDDNNRKPICRFHFNTAQKYLGTFDAEKNETRHAIDSLDDVFAHADAIKAMVAVYDKPEED